MCALEAKLVNGFGAHAPILVGSDGELHVQRLVGSAGIPDLDSRICCYYLRIFAFLFFRVGAAGGGGEIVVPLGIASVHVDIYMYSERNGREDSSVCILDKSEMAEHSFGGYFGCSSSGFL